LSNVCERKNKIHVQFKEYRKKHQMSVHTRAYQDFYINYYVNIYPNETVQVTHIVPVVSFFKWSFVWQEKSICWYSYTYNRINLLAEQPLHWLVTSINEWW
jgi:hypothetical protein